MHEIIDNADERVKRLERMIKDNDMGNGVAVNTRQNGSGLKRLALESLKKIRGNEAVEGLKRLISDPDINQELKIYASNLLEALVDDAKNRKLNRASAQDLICTNSQLEGRVNNRTNSAISKSTDVSFQADKRLD